MVPEAGLEPARCCHRQILSLVRLPFRHAGTACVDFKRLFQSSKNYSTISFPRMQPNFLLFSFSWQFEFSLTKVIIYDNFLGNGMPIFQEQQGVTVMKDSQTRTGPRYEVVEQLKQARKSQNVTQEVLAERVGTKKSNISRFESGNYNPTLDFLVKVAGSLGKQVHIRIK